MVFTGECHLLFCRFPIYLGPMMRSKDSRRASRIFERSLSELTAICRKKFETVHPFSSGVLIQGVRYLNTTKLAEISTYSVSKIERNCLDAVADFGIQRDKALVTSFYLFSIVEIRSYVFLSVFPSL